MKRPVTDADLDRLLAARPCEPTAAFGRRWHILHQDISRAQRRAWWRRPGWWMLVALPTAAALALMLWLPPVPAPTSEDFELLLRLDESLEPAGALLDPLNRELCLELAPENRPSLPLQP